MKKLFGGAAIPLLLILGLAGCASPAPKIRVEDAWVRPDPLMENAAGYLVIYNDGSQADALVGVRAEFVGKASVHQTIMEEGGLHRMEPVPRLEVPAKGQVELRPLGYHMMLMGLKENLEYGQKVTLILEFEKSGEIVVEAEVRQQ